MYKATIAIASLLAGIGVCIGVEFLGSAPHNTTKAPKARIYVPEMQVPPLEPASAPELDNSDEANADVIVLDEARIPRQRPKAIPKQPMPTPARELYPCSEWEEVGPKLLKNPDGTVEMRHARSLC